MKAIKKFTSIILVLSTVLSSFVMVFADEEEPNKKYNYVSFGDSITRGVCVENMYDTYSIEDPTRNDGRNVKESYTYQIAKALGYTMPADIKDKNATYWPLALNGNTTSFVNDLLGVDDGYFDTQYDHSEGSTRYDQMLAYFGDPLSYISEDKQVKDGYEGEIGTICSARELIANANLITLGVGDADVMMRPLMSMDFSVLFGGSEDETEGEEAKSENSILTAILGVIPEFEKAYKQWDHNYTKLLDYIKHNTRKDCTVVLVGAVNPVFGLNYSEEYMIPLGNIINILSDRMNKRMEQLAKRYGFEFVDVSVAETALTMGKTTTSVKETTEYSFEYFMSGAAGDDMITLLMAGLHPTALGYTQMANLILDRLAENKRFNIDTTIKVDLGKIDPLTIKYAKVDGIERQFYVDVQNRLCIPCYTTLAKTLTVLGHDGEQLSIYDLSYSNGYVAKRVYTTNNLSFVKGTFGNIVNAVKTQIFSEKQAVTQTIE